jgi:hypothetical protein
MDVIMTQAFENSREFEIDSAVEQLVGKMMSGQITPAEESHFRQLMVQRSRMMRQGMGRQLRRKFA